MSYCKHCQIHYESDQKDCVLCQQPLVETTTPIKSYYPTFKKQKTLVPLIKYFMYINFMTMIITIFIDAQDLVFEFSIIVSLSNLYAIVLASFIFIPEFWTTKISKFLSLTLLGLLLLTLVIRETYWFIDYVLPLTLTANILLVGIVGLFYKKNDDLIFELFVLIVLGFIPGVLQITQVTIEHTPSIISFIISLTLFTFILLFRRKLLFEAIKRRFHL
jgi:hypothetical protein